MSIQLDDTPPQYFPSAVQNFPASTAINVSVCSLTSTRFPVLELLSILLCFWAIALSICMVVLFPALDNHADE